MPFFDDVGFWKRAQIAANDLALAGVAEFDDLDELTIFADNVVPHVLRVDGVLVYDATARRPHRARRADRRPARPTRSRSARARSTRACTSRASSACRSARSTRGCGTAARSRATRRYRATGLGPSTTGLAGRAAGRTGRSRGPRRRTCARAVSTTSPSTFTFDGEPVIPEVVELVLRLGDAVLVRQIALPLDGRATLLPFDGVEVDQLGDRPSRPPPGCDRRGSPRCRLAGPARRRRYCRYRRFLSFAKSRVVVCFVLQPVVDL